MRAYEPDPVYRHARREALVLLAIFAVALTYTLSVCRMFGYDRDPGQIVNYFGIPDWVVWGVFLPWTGCVLVTVWFCFRYMEDDPLGEEDPSPNLDPDPEKDRDSEGGPRSSSGGGG